MGRIFPLGTDSGPLTAAEMAQLVAMLDPPVGYDVVGLLAPGITVDDLARSGATWAVDGPLARPSRSPTSVAGSRPVPRCTATPD